MMRTAALLALASLLAAPGAPPPAQDGGLLVEEAGFGFLPAAPVLNLPVRGTQPPPKFVGRNEAWVPFQAILVNPGPAREGVLTLRQAFTGPAEAVTYSRRITLPQDGRKRVTFPVRATYDPMYLGFRDDKAGGVTLGGESEFLVREPRIVNPRTEIVLLASDAKISYGHLVVPRRRSENPADRILVVVAPDQLPQTALEYDMVGLLVLDDIAADALTQAQASAIHQWVCRGGAVVMTLLRNAHRIKGTHLEPLVAGTPGEVRNVREMKAFEEATTYPCPFDAETAIQTFDAREGTEGDPALLQRRIDRGLSVACGLPLSSSALEVWPRSPILLEAFLRLSRHAKIGLPGGNQSQRVREPVAPALKGSILKSVPPFKAVALLMGIYIVVLVVVPYAVLRPFKRLELAWIGIVALALIGSGVVYGTGTRYLRAESVACRVTLVEGGGVPGPHMRHNFWCLFSARGGYLNLGFENPPVVPFPFGRQLGLRGAGSVSEPLQVAYDADAQVRDFPTYAQDSTMFETTDMVSLPGRIRFQIKMDPDLTIRGHLEADESLQLRDAWFVDGQRIVRVQPGPIEIPRGAASVVPSEGSLLERKGFEAVTRAIETADYRVPVLLYRYEGTPSLTNSDIKEEAIHFGIVEPTEWRVPVDEITWTGTLYFPPELPEQEPPEFEFTLRTREVPPGRQVEAVTIQWDWQRYGSLQLYNRRDGTWTSAVSTPRLEGCVARSPFGGLAIKARLLTHSRSHAQELLVHRGSVQELTITGHSKLKASRP